MRKEFKDAIKAYIGTLANKMVVHHYIVTVWENERTDTMFAVELDLARAAAKQWDGCCNGFPLALRHRAELAAHQTGP